MKEQYKIINNDSFKELDIIAENSIDSIITDPPYEIRIYGKNMG